jgi:hypothetical protein
MIEPSQVGRRLPRGSIRHRLMFWGLALLAVALVLNTVAGSIYTRRGMQKSTAELQAEVASSTARRIQSFLARKIERLHDTGAAMTMFSPGGEEQRLLSLLLMKNDPSFSEIAVLDFARHGAAQILGNPSLSALRSPRSKRFCAVPHGCARTSL